MRLILALVLLALAGCVPTPPAMDGPPVYFCDDTPDGHDHWESHAEVDDTSSAAAGDDRPATVGCG